jgi:hypothetical protein
MNYNSSLANSFIDLLVIKIDWCDDNLRYVAYCTSFPHITASHRRAAVAKSKLRENLYFRLVTMSPN